MVLSIRDNTGSPVPPLSSDHHASRTRAHSAALASAPYVKVRVWGQVRVHKVVMKKITHTLCGVQLPLRANTGPEDSPKIINYQRLMMGLPIVEKFFTADLCLLFLSMKVKEWELFTRKHWALGKLAFSLNQVLKNFGLNQNEFWYRIIDNFILYRGNPVFWFRLRPDLDWKQASLCIFHIQVFLK